MIIRKAKLKEINEISELFSKISKYHQKLNPKIFDLKKDLGPKYKKHVTNSIHSKNSLLLVAEENNKIVGMCLADLGSRPPVFKVRKIGNLSDAYVLPAYRKKGISKAFLEESFKWFKSKGIKRVEAGVYFDNKVARETWKKQGFIDSKATIVKFI
jgi:GNAT superfamily N-acetyltransferase